MANTTTNSTLLRGLCPPPFFQEALFPEVGGRFIIPLVAKPEQCFNEITPHAMDTSTVCAASGSFLLGGGWAGAMWIFLRALSLHLQICWQLVNSLADFWIPLLVFGGLTLIIQFSTFGYCIKVYLASLADSSATTEGSGMPSYAASVRTMTPRQAYRRVRRVIQLQWRGIVIVLIIMADVIFFAIVFVFQDNTVMAVKEDSNIALPWVACLIRNHGDKEQCLDEAGALVISVPTVIAVLILLAMNGIWLLILLGRWSMVTGWIEYFATLGGKRANKEFVSKDARADMKPENRSYEMLSHSKSESYGMSPIHPEKPYASLEDGRRTPDYFGQAPDYFGQAARYQPHQRSFSAPRPPQHAGWDATATYARSSPPPPVPPAAYDYEGRNPLGMNRI
ncbi:hypothetical protein DL766_002190 [Monosporascus sp. MC13-8B]|uniref:G-protein coupled receptors family 2 profile 2 domain-containing protein n=1 Tax=Monosporascus cannonballus TaxID=155416 RepID=A0ABY0H039_9PEZI|nr:hypothetical protein DL762_007134 [Monosporascus cannonballus]RYO88339.1 hypothetical protein DL763_006036 [Monosporascus cannonballus]RYP36141.1 hypothetical protein DL766_002190 [Monosporascus sp. MC13-8B]